MVCVHAHTANSIATGMLIVSLCVYGISISIQLVGKWVESSPLYSKKLVGREKLEVSYFKASP